MRRVFFTAIRQDHGDDTLPATAMFFPLATRHEIARVLGDQGKLADAEAEFRQVLDGELRVLGPDHPSTLATVNWLKLLQRDDDK